MLDAVLYIGTYSITNKNDHETKPRNTTKTTTNNEYNPKKNKTFKQTSDPPKNPDRSIGGRSRTIKNDH